MGLGNRFLITALLFGTMGMALGLAMGASHDFTLMPVHAHLNLLGYVGMFIAGLYYRTAPEAAESRMAEVHYWANAVGVVMLTGPLAGLLLGGAPQLGLLVLGGGVILISSMMLFILIIAMSVLRSPGVTIVPAE